MTAATQTKTVAAPPPFVLRGPGGLGDSIYLRVICEHLVATQGAPVEVLSNFPGIFSGVGVAVAPYDKKRKYTVRAHYGWAKHRAGSNQWQDMLVKGGFPMDLPLRTNWTTSGSAALAEVRAAARGRRIVLVHGGRLPMGELLPEWFRRNQMEVLPQEHAMRAAAREASNRHLTVAIGAGPKLYEVPCELDLWGRTIPEDLMDLAAAADAVIGQCSWAVPLAEVHGKPLLAIFARQAMRSSNQFVNAITPQKVLAGKRSRFAIDDELDAEIEGKVDALFNA